MTRLCFLYVIVAACTNASASDAFATREQEFVLTGAQLGKAFQVEDRKALDEATAATAKAFGEMTRWLDAHQDQRTPRVARIVTAGEKLIASANRLRGLLDQHAAGPYLQQAAIDGLHRWNEVIDAHQGDPVRKEIAI